VNDACILRNMHEKYLGNDTEAALAVVASLYNNEPLVRIINDGLENLVVIVNETYVVRFPRTEQIWQSSTAERYILEKLSSFSDMPIPKLIRASEDPAYIVTSYVKGDHLTIGQIRSLPERTLQKIGMEMAEFAYAFHTRLLPDNIQPFLTPRSWSYDDYLKRVLFDRQDPNPKVDALAKQYYQAWLDKKLSDELVIHDDLHTGNLLFDDEYNLSVLDFGAVTIGTAEQELRQAYRLGDVALESAASTYETLSGKPFDRDTAKLWTITQELGAYCREESGGAHERAAENLWFWFPELSTE
jgi:aminoglycoside phosphotransferase (APT) family kinase protein